MMDGLPTLADARLPQSYEAAKAALAQCADIDECQDWADRAAALASYARQADDRSLETMAQRIRARAVRRAGELYKQIEPQRGGDRRSDQRDAAGPLMTRKQAAGDAGMSERQMKTAIRVANVPAERFEEWVESDAPPTLSQLAQQGTKPKARPIVDLQGRDPGEFNRALHFTGDLEHAVNLLERLDVETVAPTLIPKEREQARRLVQRIDAIADRIIVRLSE